MALNIPATKKKAAELEQKKQYDKALALYIQVIEAGSDSPDDVDVSLYNRVGDLMLRQGQVGDAVTYYERAVDLYAEGGFYNNAIALCNKILRQSPGRSTVYYKLGKISAQKGFKNDAKVNFLEYASRKQKDGDLNEAFRALKEFADLCPDQDDIRLMLADQLGKEGRSTEALEQLQILFDRYTAEGDVASANAAAERMRVIDPTAQPMQTEGYSKQRKSADSLVFLDLDVMSTGPRKATPPRVSRAVPVPPPEIIELPQPLELDSAASFTAPAPVAPAPVAPSPEPASLDLIDLGAPVLRETIESTPLPFITDEEPSAGSELTFLTPDAPPVRPTTGSGLPLIEVTEDEGGSLLAEYGHSLGMEDVAITDAVSLSGPGLGETNSDSSLELMDLSPSASDVSGAGHVGDGSALDDLLLDIPTEAPDDGLMAGIGQGTTEMPLLDLDAPAEASAPIADAPMADVPIADAPIADAPIADAPFDLPLLDMSAPAVPMPEAVTPEIVLTPSTPPDAFPSIGEPPRRRSSTILARSADALSIKVLDDPENWDLRRNYGEALLEDGDRDGGIAELEAAMVGYDKSDDLIAARSVADEIVRLNPNSIRHHQKRVEYCFRSQDRAGLVDAYVELAAALLRDGQADKSRSVYQRVLELAPGEVRAMAALDAFSAPEVPAAPAPATPASTPITKPAAPAAAVPPRRYSGTLETPLATPAQTPPPAAPADDFIDLGDFLRDEEPEKNTRMIVDEKEPTGDEDADFADMLRKFKQGVAQNVEEEDYDSHYDLGVAYKEMGLVDEAIAEFQKALRGSQHRVRAHESLGTCFVEKGMWQVATTILQRALTEPGVDDSQLIGVHYLLGNAFEQMGRSTDAMNAYQRVYAVDITFRDVNDRINALSGSVQ